MRRLLIILLVLILSVWLGTELARHAGYALFTYERWAIKMPLWVCVLGLILILLVSHFMLRFLNFVLHLDRHLGSWVLSRQQNKAHDKTHRGLLHLLQQEWRLAERSLVEGARQARNPLLNYLAAAEAAHAQKALERSDGYLQKAYQLAPQEEVLIGLVQAKLQLQEGQLEQATATLTHLRQVAPLHPQVLRLLEKIYIRLADWQQLLLLLPALRKAKVINAEQSGIFEKNIYGELFKEAQRKNKSIHEVRALWASVPKQLRVVPDILERYANLLKGDKHSAEEIEPLLRKALDKEWQDSLGKMYGLLAISDPSHALSKAEAWLPRYGKRAALLLTLGRLSMRCQLWGKARQYLEACLQQQPSSEAQLVLADLLEQLGEKALALQYYREGLQWAVQQENKKG